MKQGDIVVVPCVVTGLDPHGDYINVALETRWPMWPGDIKTAILVNTTQVILVERSVEKSKTDSMHVLDVVEEIKKGGSGVLRSESDPEHI